MLSNHSTSDTLFIMTLLIGSAVVVAFCLWLAQVLALGERLGRRNAEWTCTTRAILGLISLCVSAMLMLGAFPGTTMNSWTASACAGTALMGIMTISSAYRASRSQLGVRLHTEDASPATHTKRKAA